MIESTTIGEYLSALGSKSATPGGGAVAALSGAQAAALLEMVCNLTRGNDAQIAAIRVRTADARRRFLELANEDMQCFDRVMSAWKLPPGERDTTMQPALKGAAIPPLGMIALAISLVDDAAALAEIGNKNLLTDVGVAVCLIQATVQSAGLNVLVNLQSITDAEFNREARSALSSAQEQLPGLVKLGAEIEQHFGSDQ